MSQASSRQIQITNFGRTVSFFNSAHTCLMVVRSYARKNAWSLAAEGIAVFSFFLNEAQKIKKNQGDFVKTSAHYPSSLL
jgi:hypothetical protein